MPPTPSDPRPGVSRRTAMGLAAGVAVVSGCTPTGVDRRSRPQPPAPPVRDEDPDVALAAAVLTGEQAMLDRVLATVRRHPGLRARLSGVETAHRTHIRLLTDAVPDDSRPIASPSSPASSSPASSSPAAGPSASGPSASSTPSTGPSTAPSPGPSGSPTAPVPAVVPARPGPALAMLAREQERLSVLVKRNAFAAESGAFARVLASMAASAAQHAVTLTRAAAGGKR